MKVICKPEVTQAEALKALNRHLRDKHAGRTARIQDDKVKVPGAGNRQGDNKANQKATERPRTETRRSEFRGNNPRIEPTFVPDSEWVASTQGNVAFHQSPRKTGRDGFSIYERTLYGKGVLDTLLKHPEKMRKARAHLPSRSVSTIGIKVQKQPNLQPPKVYVQVTKTQQGKDSAVIVQAPTQSRPATTGRTDAATQLSLVLMKRLKEIDTIAGNTAVLPCCSDAELTEALRILQSVVAGIARQTRKRQT
jgi:hypothetical protein